MNDAFIYGGLRTPRGKGSVRGALAGLSALDLLGHLNQAIVKRYALDPVLLDDYVIGCATQTNEQGANIARTATMLANWPGHVPGVTVNRFCASGIAAVNMAAASVRTGESDLVLAGGVESVSRAPIFSDKGPLWTDPAVIAKVGSVHMGISADLVATLEGFGREELDAYGLRTRQKARDGHARGDGAGDCIAIKNTDEQVVLEADELLAFAPTAQYVAELEPAFQQAGDEGQDALAMSKVPGLERIDHVHTKATSPPLADAAALLLVGDAQSGSRAGLHPRARIVGTASVAGDPVIMLTAGQDAVEQLLNTHGLRPSDVDVFEFAEAFSALCLRFQRDLEVDDNRYNIAGGTLALGHAFGATGAILVLNAVGQLEAKRGRYGIAAVSGAGGLGVATLIERV